MNAVNVRVIALLAVVMMLWGVFSVTYALETDPVSTAPIKFQMNMAAYKGITFGMMFGTPMFFGREDVKEPEYAYPLEDWYAITLGTFVDKLLVNVEQWPTGSDVAIKPLIKGDLEKLKVFLAEDAAAAEKIKSKGFKTWRVSSFCANNLKGTESTKGASLPCFTLPSNLSEADAKIEMEANAKAFSERLVGLFDYFDKLENDGLVLPWTMVMVKEQNQIAFRNLASNTRFLQRLGRCTYVDFYTISAAHPFVDAELLDLTQQASRCGLFGKLTAYLSDGLKASSKCCDTSTLKCISATADYQCSMLGLYCTAVSDRCP